MVITSARHVEDVGSIPTIGSQSYNSSFFSKRETLIYNIYFMKWTQIEIETFQIV